MNTPRFLIYNASAGSGKTYTITKAYLSILLKQDHVFAFQNILAITFTNKAAAEMKQRIVKALIYFAGLQEEESQEHLLTDISEEINLSKEDIKKKSLIILKYLIPNYSGFEVSTIDSFNHRIIRTFAKDLRLSQDFEIDLETQPFIEKAVDNLIEDVGEDDNLTSWLVDFVHYKINRNKSGNIRLDLNKYANLVLNENNYEALEKLKKINLKDLKISKLNLNKKESLIKQELFDLALDFFRLIEKSGIENSHFKRRSIPNYFKKISNGDFPKEFNSQWHNIEQTDFYNKTTKAPIADKIDNIRADIENMFLESKKLCLDYHLCERVLKSIVPLAMISEINNRINHIKGKEGILFINDFNRLISESIKHQPAPFIYERLGEKFRHYFIDEFQDTSKLQWQNITPLVENAITAQHDDGISGSLFLVGDVKQSIYEWRGGDPKQFLDLSQGRSNPFSIKATLESLDNNWRSGKVIVDFNNRFFFYAADFLKDPNHQKLYKKVKQNAKKTLDGYVDIQFLAKIEDKELMQKQRITKLQNTILSLKNQGYALGDICIIVRKNKYGTAIADAFNKLDNPIPVESQDSLLIVSDVQVELLTKFLELIENYHQEISIDFMLMWLEQIGYSQENYHHILNEAKSLNLLVFLTYLKSFGIDFSLHVYENLSLYDKAEYTIRALNLDKNANAYLQFFLDEIFNFSLSKSKNISLFLDYWKEQKQKKSISTSGNSKAVKIMTIHKSKGLQFPIVIYAHANFVLEDLKQTEDWISIDEENYGVPYIYEQISENNQILSPGFSEAYHRNASKVVLANLNAAYVCMTRAVEQLYMVCEPVAGKVTFEKILIDFLKNEDIYNENQDHYSFGSKAVKKENTISYSQEADCFNFHSCAVENYYQNLSANVPVKYKDSQAVSYGQNIHDLLQKIVYTEDLDRIDVPKTINPIINNIVNHSKLSSYFKKEWSIFNEKEIIFRNQIFRPDRICVQGKDAVIIDYKTGKEESKHIEQLTTYKNAIQNLGYKVKKAILVYIRKDIYIKTL